ncbi:MAG: LysR family transcriptional regulator [Lachnospiraceae bacterium]|nr:LysR family transcriptional regulator [Lachnospiraceae bacterium]
MLIDTRIIEYVIAIAEEGSLNKAAEKLFISQPALSQRLKKLEDELGTELFRRENSGLVITDAGRVYINGGRSILQIKQEAMAKLSSMDQSQTDVIRFGCATSHALEAIPQFWAEYPDMLLSTRQCTTPTAKEDLIMGRMDMAVLLTPTLQHSVLEYLPLASSQALVAVPPQHPAASKKGGEGNPFREGYGCLEEDYFILSPSGSYARELEDRALKSMGIRPRILCEISDNETKRYMLSRNLGNAFLPGYSIQAEDAFVTFPLDPPLSFYIVAAYPKSTVLSEPMKCLLKTLLTVFDGNR